MGLYGIGLPAGAALGGALSGILISHFDWRAPFIFGSAITALMFFVSLRAFPESVEFLVERHPLNALRTLNLIAKQLGHEFVSELPAPRERVVAKAVTTAVFGGPMLARTSMLWIAYALLISAFYFANTWTAKLLADATGNTKAGGLAGVLVPLGGVIGACIFAALSTAIRPRIVTVLVLLAGAVAFFLYAGSLGDLKLALWLALAVGACANGGVAAFYAISPSIYPASARASGVGWMIAFGRAIAILTPITAGYLFASGYSPQTTYRLFAGALTASAAITFLLDRSYRSKHGFNDVQAEH